MTMNKKTTKIYALRSLAALSYAVIDELEKNKPKNYNMLKNAYNQIAHELKEKATKLEKQGKKQK